MPKQASGSQMPRSQMSNDLFNGLFHGRSYIILDKGEERMEEEKKKRLGVMRRERQRASSACTACRSRRRKCVWNNGSGACTSCQKRGLLCIVEDDERKRPTSKAYVNSLEVRIALLEELVRRTGQSVPEPDDSTEQQFTSSVVENGLDSSPSQEHGTSVTPGRPCNEDLMSTECTLPESGQSRIGIDNHNEQDYDHGADHRSLTTAAARQASQDGHEYFTNKFWTLYSSVVPLVDKTAFFAAQSQGDGEAYSEFLHLCILAMGYRLARSDRQVQKQVRRPQIESLFQKRAKTLFERGLKNTDHVSTIQGLLILSDLECGVGRLEFGWMLARRACDLFVSRQGSLDLSALPDSKEDKKALRMIHHACIFHDQFWKTSCGRSLYDRRIDPSPDHDMRTFVEAVALCSDKTLNARMEADVYEAFIELSRIYDEILRILNERHTYTEKEEELLLAVVSLDGELNDWYITLPDSVRAPTKSIGPLAPSSLHLHQYYHSSLIMLHWPFVRWKRPADEDRDRTSLSRIAQDVCFTNAVRISELWSRSPSDLAHGPVVVPGLQYLVSATIVLVACLTRSNDADVISQAREHLGSIRHTVNYMSSVCPLAGKMSTPLTLIMEDPGLFGLGLLQEDEMYGAHMLFRTSGVESSSSRQSLSPASSSLQSEDTALVTRACSKGMSPPIGTGVAAVWDTHGWIQTPLSSGDVSFQMSDGNTLDFLDGIAS